MARVHKGGSSLFSLTPNPRCGDVECQPPAGREIVVYTLWLEYTSGQFTFFLTPNPGCGDVECQPPAGREIVVYGIMARVHKGGSSLFFSRLTPAAVMCKANPLEAERLSFMAYWFEYTKGAVHFSPNA